MSERRTDQEEKEWSDVIPDPEGEEERPDPYKQTYRDGTAKNECWRED